MGEIKTGGPAFPDGSLIDTEGECHTPYYSGMDLRDWFAGQALAALIGRHRADVAWGQVAPTAYRIADAMIAEGCEGGVNPLQAELDEAKKHIAYLESLRPHWAKGFSSDSVAAQCSTDALNSLWKLLGATNQTEAVERVKEMLRAREGDSNAE